MGNQQNSIVLNGKLYDAVTGKIIHEPAPSSQPAPKIKKNTGLVMDGVVHHPGKSHKAKVQPKTASHHNPTHQPRQNHHPSPAKRHAPQRPATLMRRAVAKPSREAHHENTKSEAPTNVHDERTAQRLERAKTIPKSHHIQRFPDQQVASHTAHRTVSKKHATVPVEAPPEPAHHVAQQKHHTSPPQHVAPLSASETLVTNALKNARAHEAHKPFAKKPKKRLSHSLGFKRKTANLAMGSLAALLLVGFFVYQNVPNLSMRLASTRAGFNAQMPSYQPSGFSQDKVVNYSPGSVTISFKSNSDDRNFQLTQKVSNWNSEALASNYLTKEEKQYQTYQANGKTIYIYDGTNATWVNGGVWYQIEGQSDLSSEQLLKIANSI